MLTAKPAKFDLSAVTDSVWFGGSWLLGTELEKCLDRFDIDQQAWKNQNRFPKLVADHFSWREKNLAQEGISPEHLVLKVLEYGHQMTELQKKNEVIFIAWPSFERYLWIDDRWTIHDIRANKDYEFWYKHVDTPPYRFYTSQRTVWSLGSWLERLGINYYMICMENTVTGADFFPIHDHRWLLPPDQTLSTKLDFDIDQGYPTDQHRYFWPCQNHPNVEGHCVLSGVIIKHLTNH